MVQHMYVCALAGRAGLGGGGAGGRKRAAKEMNRAGIRKPGYV